MSLGEIFKTSGSGMSAQLLRLNTVASNLANAGSVASSPDKTYRARIPEFAAVQQSMLGSGNKGPGGVQVTQILESQTPATARHQPGHPMADKNGYVYVSNVNVVEEMAHMMAASRAYQNNVEAINTAKDMMQRTLTIAE